MAILLLELTAVPGPSGLVICRLDTVVTHMFHRAKKQVQARSFEFAEVADVFFILTTNRPDQLEPALASRPGRIDQAIEFPLPDEEGRIKLVKLYSRGLQVPEQLMHLIVCRTKGVSPAFIKELMRRSAQFQFELGNDAVLQPVAVNAAIEEMVFVGGALNLKLLGGSATELGAGPDG